MLSAFVNRKRIAYQALAHISGTSNMHEAKMLRELEKMEDGFEQKVQWGDVLQHFCGMPLARIDRAFLELTPSQLATMQDAINGAKTKSKERSIQAIKAMAVQRGVSIAELLEYFGNHPKDVTSGDIKKSDGRSFKTRFGLDALGVAKEIVSRSGSAPEKITGGWLRDKSQGTEFEGIAMSAFYNCASQYQKWQEEVMGA